MSFGENLVQPSSSYFGIAILALGLALAVALAMLIPYAAKRVPASWTGGRLLSRRRTTPNKGLSIDRFARGSSTDDFTTPMTPRKL